MAAVVAAFGHVEAIEEGAAVLAHADLRTARPAGIDRPALVSLGPQLTGLLDLATTRDATWLDVIRQLRDQRRPIYVELDAKTRRISQLLQPLLQPVGDIRENERGDMQVNFLLSHAVHVLHHGHPRFKELLRLLRTAQKDESMVWVVETLDSPTIVDVKPADERLR
ncbi:hypothetical protein CDN99_21320 [Roseateles aquatilis]|uniref:Uncharacterized protein n=1 Tax=Roseateles aquatilis TaxID=431061 RepID=A0A246IZ59_9BURK|nr:hypothetical protein [Roseateles aquatilis]OWQ85629.1 hypothetical protein CDN99_21320 [Roseateles aquatilis]